MVDIVHINESNESKLHAKEAQRKYRERNKEKYNEYMKQYYHKKCQDESFRQKRNAYRRKAYQKQKTLASEARETIE